MDSLDQVEARLRRDLWLDCPEGLKLYKAQGTGHVTAQARNCNSLKKLSDDHRLVVVAAAQAQKASDFILNRQEWGQS